tara:strand:- start:386 stop:991 length:606 start_codon:yes stop_codon:yes gene_type:complete
MIVLEGIDQSGKQTQTHLLSKKLGEHGFKVETLSFPLYSTVIGKEIKNYLQNNSTLPIEAMHMLLSANRWELKSLICEWISQNKYIIIDRYSYSNYAYGNANGLELSWLKSLDSGLPSSDLTILLDIPVEVSFSRKNTQRDINERDSNILNKVRKLYLNFARELEWPIINGELNSDEIAKEIWGHVKNKFNLQENNSSFNA